MINGRWSEIDSGTTLRKKLSSQLALKYTLKAKELVEKMTNLEKNPAPTETKSASEDDDGMKKLQKLAGRTAGIGLDLRRTHNKNNIMKEAKEHFFDKLFLDKLDNNPYLLCFKNGVIDFKKKEFRMTKPDDYVSLCTHISYVEFDENNSLIIKDFLVYKTQTQDYYDHISFDIKENETLALVGLSGAGKSTLIRHLNRLIDPTEGEIIVEGTDVLTLSKDKLIDFRRHKMSMVFQRFGLFPHKTVIQNVGYGLEMQGISENERNKTAMEKIESVGLSGFENQYPNQLSGGMQQRVGLARALATDTDIMLMDEAFSALDPLIRSDMQKQLLDLQSQLKKTIVFITHDLDESLKLGDHIGILNAGKLVQVGRPVDIIMNPADDYVAAFVKDVNRTKVLKIKTIMKDSIQSGSDYPKVAMDSNIESCLPLFLDGESVLNVTDDEKNIVGSISREEVANILKRY